MPGETTLRRMRRVFAAVVPAAILTACAGLPAYTVVDEAKVLQVQRAAGVAAEADVLSLLGPPWRKVAFPNISQTAWDYVMRDTWGYWVDAAVMIDARGRVADVVLVRREPVDK